MRRNRVKLTNLQQRQRLISFGEHLEVIGVRPSLARRAAKPMALAKRRRSRLAFARRDRA